MSGEVFATCPFNSSHRIVMYRMPAHVIKCRKNYNGPPLEQCIYNATHFVPVGTMSKHLESCNDCYLFNQPKYIEIVESMQQNTI